MLLLKCLPLFTLGILNILVSLGVLLRDVRKLNNLCFFGLAFSIGGWVLGIAAFLLTNAPNTALIWAKVYYLFPLIIAASLVLFVESFPKYQRIEKKVYLLVIGGWLALAVPLVFNHSFLTESLVYHSWGKEIILNKSHYLFYSIYFLSCAMYALVRIYQKGKTEKDIYGAQANLFFKGFLFTAIFGVFFNLILPWVGNYRLIHLGPLFTNIYIMAVAYSIVRHRMFDVRLVVARSLAYLLSLLVLVSSYVFLSFVIASKILVQVDSAPGERAINIVLLIFVALTYGPIKQFFDRITNRIFYHDAYDPQQLLDQLNRFLVAQVDIDPLLQDVAKLIVDSLKADYCDFLIRETSYFPQRVIGTKNKLFNPDDVALLHHFTPTLHHRIVVKDALDDSQQGLKKFMDKYDVDILARLVTTVEYEVEGIGYLLIGPKKSGNPYTNQDEKIMRIIANELVIAIQNSLRYEEIEQFNVTLQEKVDTATKRLQKTNEKLQTLDETKDEFISMASHQLRTPLTSVKGYLSMVLEGDAGETNEMQHKLLDQAFVSSQRMVYLIADLLNVSRLRTGKFLIEPIATNLAEVVDSEVKQLQNSAKSRGLELTYTKPEMFPTLMLDEVKIRQVVMNFMDNAIYYTPRGGHIRVELKETDKAIEYTVTDDGIGVPKSERHHLFTKFYRAPNAKKARPDGTGLGLFMAKKAVIAQGGTILFSSHEGSGSTFGFSFEKAKLIPNPSVPAKLG